MVGGFGGWGTATGEVCLECCGNGHVGLLEAAPPRELRRAALPRTASTMAWRDPAECDERTACPSCHRPQTTTGSMQALMPTRNL